MQATEPVQIAIQTATVPVRPTEESQADKGIDHPLVSCNYCDAVWRSHERSRCPMCARKEGTHLVLDEDQTSDLMEAMLSLEVETFSFTQEQLDLQMWRFRNLLRAHAPWYDMNSRQIIQVCYQNLCVRGGTSPKTAIAIAFFKEEFAFAPEEENTFCPEIIEYQTDTQYDRMKPSW